MKSKKIIIIFLLVFCSIPAIFSQTKPIIESMTQTNLKYGERIKIKLDEEILFEDSLSVKLHGFTHKMPLPDGPTKATAYLTVTRGTISEEIMLSVHGSGKIQEHTEYDSLVWNGYEFQLKEFSYDESVELIILKGK